MAQSICLEKLCHIKEQKIFHFCFLLSYVILRHPQSDNNFRTLSWFPNKKRPGTRAVTKGGQLKNNCAMFVCGIHDECTLIN